MIAISACLAGKNCRYDGKSKPNKAMLKLMREHEYVLFCPESLLGIPRDPSEICGGQGADVLQGLARVITSSGEDVTKQFVQGAYLALKAISKARVAYMKENSPSCGVNFIYDGTFTNTLKCGKGVAAQLFLQSGIELMPVD